MLLGSYVVHGFFFVCFVVFSFVFQLEGKNSSLRNIYHRPPPQRHAALNELIKFPRWKTQKKVIKSPT